MNKKQLDILKFKNWSFIFTEVIKSFFKDHYEQSKNYDLEVELTYK